MKALLLIVTLGASSCFAKGSRVGVELGGTGDLRKLPSLYTRLSFGAPIGPTWLEGGLVGLVGRDGGYGFDVMVARPIDWAEPVVGSRFLVWEESMSVGFPLGFRVHQSLGGAELTVGITVAPTVHLIAEEKNTVLVDSFIGLRF